MAERCILVADAEAAAWDRFREALGESWTVAGAVSCGAALAEAQKRPFHVVVANYDLPDTGGAELLNRLRADHPKTLRFVAADLALKEKVMCHVAGGHQFLALPFDPATLKGFLERSLAVDYGMSNSMRELVGRVRTFPTIPSLYTEVVSALNNPNATTVDIGAIIAKDMAMTTKLVQVINSAYFGLPRTITDPTEAVGILGFETVKALILTVKLLSQYDKLKPVYFSIDQIWRHSTNVARTARVMALLETGDTQCSGAAYTAGLMHDLGKVILAANFDEQYHGAHTVARKQQVPLWEVEKDIFGATHGEIAAYLLGLWGLSSEVVNVAALHHHPLRSGDKAFTALTAVHVANALEYEGNPDADGLPSPVLDVAYLQQLDLEDRVQLWRQARLEPDAAMFDTRLLRKKSLKTSEKAAPSAVAPAPPPNKFAPAKSAAPPLGWRSFWRWLAIGLSASAAVVLLAELEMMRLESTAEKPEIQVVAKNLPPPVKHETPKPAAPAKLAEETKPAPAPPAHVAPALAAIAPPPGPIPPPAAPKTGFDRLKLQAIFYNAHHAAALINNKLTSVNEEVAECRVLDITPSTVTMEYQNQRKTFTMK